MMDGSVPLASNQGVLALDSWEQPPRRPRDRRTAPVLAVEGFEGPLDWLLDLARTRRIDLSRLSIVALVEAFADALTAALDTPDVQAVTLGRWGDWLVMAADLTLLRSRLLMPADAGEAQDARDAAEQLRQRLLDRAGIALAADWLEGRDQLGRDVFARGQAGRGGAVRAGRAGDITALLRACLAAIQLPLDAAALYRVPGPPFWSAADAAGRIRAMLPLMGAGDLLYAFLPEVPADTPHHDLRCRAAVASTFLAGLELARDGSIAVQQEIAWAAIQVRRGQGTTAGEAAA